MPRPFSDYPEPLQAAVNAFTFDPAGDVIVNQTRIRFADLPPFMQGYVQPAMLSTEWPSPSEGYGPSSHVIRFDWLAPSTLEAMMKDCAVFEAHPVSNARHPLDAEAGRRFWESCQRGERPETFPPLTLTLGDDGLIYQREAGA
jgi:hypothetical protein